MVADGGEPAPNWSRGLTQPSRTRGRGMDPPVIELIGYLLDMSNALTPGLDPTLSPH